MAKTDERWLITATGPDYEMLMSFYEGIDRQAAITEFVKQHFKATKTFVLEVHSVSSPQKVQGTFELKLELKEF